MTPAQNTPSDQTVAPIKTVLDERPTKAAFYYYPPFTVLAVTFAGQPPLATDERSVKTAVSTIVTYESEDENLRGLRKDLILGNDNIAADTPFVILSEILPGTLF